MAAYVAWIAIIYLTIGAIFALWLSRFNGPRGTTGRWLMVIALWPMSMVVVASEIIAQHRNRRTRQ